MNTKNTTRGRMLSRAVLIGALLVAGCGDEGAMALSEGDAGTGTGGAAGQAAQTGGAAGSAQTGTGGASAAGGTIGSDFTSADHDICMNWPVCPDDVFSPLTDTGRVLSQQCTSAFDGGRLSCASCFRRSTCEPFVGRCIARFLMPGNPSGWYASALTVQQCRSIADSNRPVVTGLWALCTGDAGVTTIDSSGAPQVGVNAKTVCKD